jgi:hypothetical protein
MTAVVLSWRVGVGASLLCATAGAVSGLVIALSVVRYRSGWARCDRGRQALRRLMTTTVVCCLLALPSLAAWAADVPQLNVAPMCHGIADQGADPSLEAGDPTVSFKQCMESESADKATLAKEWSTFTAVDQQQCTGAVTMGGLPSYTDLVTCLEMARDVEKDRTAQQQSVEQPNQKPSQPHHKSSRHRTRS